MLIKTKDLERYVSKKNLELQASYLLSNQLSKDELTEASIEEIRGAFGAHVPLIFFCGNENNSMQIYRAKMKTRLCGVALGKNIFFCVVNRRDLMEKL